jgi:hypothetical protein
MSAVAASRVSRPWTTASVEGGVDDVARHRAGGVLLRGDRHDAGRLTRPSVGLMPTIPVVPEGHTIEPSVSVPIATCARDAATPAAEPLEEPQALRSST